MRKRRTLILMEGMFLLTLSTLTIGILMSLPKFLLNFNLDALFIKWLFTTLSELLGFVIVPATLLSLLGKKVFFLRFVSFRFFRKLRYEIKLLYFIFPFFFIILVFGLAKFNEIVMKFILGDNLYNTLIKEMYENSFIFVNPVEISNFWKFLLTFAIGFIVPISEEIFFRGILLRYLVISTGKNAGLLLNSLIFTLLHFFLYFIPIFIISLFFGFLTLKTKSILPAIFLHALTNTAMYSYYLFTG